MSGIDYAQVRSLISMADVLKIAWMAVTKLPLYEAARDLCDRAGIEVPAMRRR